MLSKIETESCRKYAEKETFKKLWNLSIHQTITVMDINKKWYNDFYEEFSRQLLMANYQQRRFRVEDSG